MEIVVLNVCGKFNEKSFLAFSRMKFTIIHDINELNAI